MSTDAIKQFLKDFSPETLLEELLPELAPLLEKTALISRLLMLIGPFVILGIASSAPVYPIIPHISQFLAIFALVSRRPLWQTCS